MILTQDQLALENSLRRILPADVVSLWIPDGYGKAKDIIRGNHGTCFGTHPNVPVIAPPIDQISACDATTDWVVTSGGVLSIDTSDKKEGTGSLVTTVASPVIAKAYYTNYNPTGSWDLSDKEDMLFWLLCDRASPGFSNVFLQIVDTMNNTRHWYIVLSAGEWKAVKCLLSTGDGGTATPPNLASINKIQIGFQTKDETAFYHKIDDLRVTGKPSLINPAVGWVFGGDDYIHCGTDKSLLRDAFSYSTWIQPIPKFRCLLVGFSDTTIPSISMSGDTVHRALIHLGNSNYRYFREANPVRYFDGKWHFVTFGITGNEQADINDSTMFIDGQTQAVYATLASGGASSKTKFLIGESSGRYYEGYQCMPVLSDVLSLEQHTNIWRATKGMFAPRG